MSTADALWAPIAADPDGCDPETYAVYADAIGGDIGERIVVMVQHRDGPVLAAYLEKQRDALYGKALAKHPSIHWDWHLGFLRGVTYMPAGPDDPVAVVREILGLECARLLRELVVFDVLSPDRYADVARPPTLRAIDVVGPVDWETRAAVAEPDVRWLRYRGAAPLPDELWAYPNVAWLVIDAPDLRDLPPRIAGLTKLFRLDVDFCYELATLPEVLWELETLRELGTTNCFALKQRYRLARINPLLAGFARARTPGRRRALETMLLFGDLDRARALATGPDDFWLALDSNVGDVRAAALAELQRAVPDPLAAAPIGRGSVVALVGKTNYDKKLLKAKLAERGAKLAGKLTDDVTHAIVGESPGGKQLAGLVVVLEHHLVRALDAPKPATDLAAIRAQLATRDERALLAAIAALQDGVDPALVGDLVIVAQDVALDKKPREGAKKLLARYAPPAVTAAMREHLKVSVLLDGLGESNRFMRITGFVRDSEGAVDGVAFARALVARARVGTQYVFANGGPEDHRAALAAIVAKHDPPTTLELQALDLARLPLAVEQFPAIETVYLYGNRFNRFPRELLRLPNLKHLDLARNQLVDVPADLDQLPIEVLSLSGNPMTEFPAGVIALAATLRELDLSSNQTYAPDETRLRGLPESIGALTRLEVLRYRYNILAEFPAALWTLPRLRELDLMTCELPAELPAQLGHLKKLDVRYSTWAARGDELVARFPGVEILAT